MKPDIIHSKDFVNDAVALIEGAANEAIAERGTFSLALSGVLSAWPSSSRPG